jgi:hypothetical protein
LRDVFYPVLKFRDEKQTFAKVEGPEVDFFQNFLVLSYLWK